MIAMNLPSANSMVAEAPRGNPIIYVILILLVAIVVLITHLIVRSGQKSRRDFELYQQSMQHQSGAIQNTANTMPSFTQDGPSIGFAALGFFFPVVGLIMYLVWYNTLPFRAKSVGKGALAGVIVYVFVVVVLVIVYSLMFSHLVTYGHVN